MDRRRIIGAIIGILFVIIACVGAALYLGLLGSPDAGVEDIGDWGDVTEEEIEIITTIWVDNPNPIGVTLGDSVEVSYELYLNEVNLANGETGDVDIPSGNSTVEVSTYIQNEKIAPWWSAFINANETIPIRADASASVGGKVSTTADLPSHEETILENSTPVITSLSEVAGGLEDNYTKTISKDELTGVTGSDWSTVTAASELGLVDDEGTVGYEIEDGWAEWGQVNEEKTTLYFHFQIHNPGDIAVPASPENVGIDLAMNEIEMFSAEANDTSLANPDEFGQGELIGGKVLRPGESEEAVYKVEMDNTKIDDWFRSHVKQEEHTNLQAKLKLVFSYENIEFHLPRADHIAYTCELQTAILIDDQETETDCGQIESLAIVGDAPDGEDSEEAKESLSAKLDADSTSGTAPHTITFDASGSTAPDTEIVTYEWTFDGGAAPAEGQQVTRIFEQSGEYEVELTVRDNAGNTDTETVVIDIGAQTSEPPTAVAEADPTSGPVSTEFNFDASSSTAPETEIVEYAWRFDDLSEPKFGEQVSHTFDTEGEYTVELVVTDDEGNTAKDTVNIVVEPEDSAAPTAVAEADPTSGEASLEVAFDASASSDPDGDIVEYIWRFKDGSTPDSGETTTHTFQTAGEYDVELVVIDSEGNRDTTTVTITVESRL